MVSAYNVTVTKTDGTQKLFRDRHRGDPPKKSLSTNLFLLDRYTVRAKRAVSCRFTSISGPAESLVPTQMKYFQPKWFCLHQVKC